MKISQSAIEIILSRNNHFSNIFYFPELESTNDYAKQINIPDNSLIITDNQTKGRGRFNKRWTSEKDKNLTFTIKKKLNYSYSDQHVVNFYYTFCIAKALENFLSTRFSRFNKNEIEVKWPNDILLSGKKICGILIEFTKNYYLVGIGLNINQTKFDIEGNKLITSLKSEFKQSLNKLEVLDSIIRVLTKNFHLLTEKNDRAIFNLWLKKYYMVNKEVLINGKKGKIMRVDPDGSIVITIDNIENKYISGDVTIIY